MRTEKARENASGQLDKSDEVQVMTGQRRTMQSAPAMERVSKLSRREERLTRKETSLSSFIFVWKAQARLTRPLRSPGALRVAREMTPDNDDPHERERRVDIGARNRTGRETRHKSNK